MPRTAIQNEQIREERKNQIIKAGMSVYLKYGIHGLEMGKVAEEANVGRGTVYHYYSNKISLLQDIVIKTLEESKELIDDTLNTQNNPLKKLEYFFKEQILMLAKQPLLYKFYKNLYDDIPLIFAEHTSEVLEKFNINHYVPIVRTFKEAIDEGYLKKMDPFRMSQIFWGAIVGAVTIYIDCQALLNDTDLVNDILRLLFDGIKERKSNE